MKKSRLLAGLLALLMLLLLFTACRKDPVTNPTPSPNENQQNGNTDDTNQGEGNTDPDTTPDNSAQQFFETNEYPMGFSICFTKDGMGFDTASNALLDGSETVSYTFTQEDYRDLYHRLSEGNYKNLPTDLTYSKLKGESGPQGPGAQYTLIVRMDSDVKTFYIDQAAIDHCSSDSNVSNLGAIVSYFYSCIDLYRARIAA